MKGIDLLSRISGIPKHEVRQIARQVMENREKLSSCSKHRFELIHIPENKISRRYKCLYCDGVVDSTNKIWYELGLEHGNGDKIK